MALGRPGSALIVAGLAFLIVAAAVVIDRTVDLLWFRSLGYSDVFWRLLAVQVGAFAIAFLVSCTYLGINAWLLMRKGGAGALRAALRAGGRRVVPDAGDVAAAVPAWRIISALITVVAAGFAFYVASGWDAVLRYVYAGEFGEVDPVYGRDTGFYLFILPLLELVQGALWILTGLATAAAAVTVIRSGSGAGGEQGGGDGRRPSALLRAILVANGTLFLAVWGWGYYLDRFDLLTDPSGAVFGAGWVDVNITRWMLWGAVAATAALAVALAWMVARERTGWLPATVGLYLGALFLGLAVVPFAFQRFVVEPNELSIETPFLEHNIRLTRRAYDLDDASEISYAAAQSLSLAAIGRNQETIDNIRLWDWRPLSATFRQLQQIRSYYLFNDVDVDRYVIDGSRRQMMLSARELSYSDLPAKTDTWVNRRLQYTHGYGVVMSFAAEKSADGRPILHVKDVPPRSPGDSIRIDRPEVYYAETMPDYRIVATGVREFDYPKGDENVYSHYAGTGGVPIGDWFARTLLALYFGDPNIVISSYVGEDTRLQMWRTVQERVSRLAPYLRLDQDPYLVVADGRLSWIQDAYTVGAGYPYSDPFEGSLNYIRNAVKIVVDAYDGSVDMYVVDDTDPVIGVYERAFPGLFQPLERMPASLKKHIRYPQDLFETQVSKLGVYHMTDPQVFYNREDVWTQPQERYAGEAIPMQPYYMLMRLPGEERLEFLLMTPLTPVNRDNMIAWVAGRSDFPGYGELVVYQLPKEELIFGPIQVEATIDQDTLISRQLSLWDQRGSRVVRGNLLVIPIDQSFLYVEPVFLRAEQQEIPQLKRVIVSDGERLAMKPTLEEAIRTVFGGARREEASAGEGPRQPVAEVLSTAREALSRAQSAARDGNWPAFGRAMDDLRRALSPAAPAGGGDGG